MRGLAEIALPPGFGAPLCIARFQKVLTGKEPHKPPCLWLHDGHAANTAFHHHVGNQGAWRFGISGRQGCIRNMFGKGGVRKCAFDPPPQCISARSEEHTSELQSLMRISYAVFCLQTKKHKTEL